VICFNFEWLFQAVSNTRATCWIRFSRLSLDLIADEFKLKKPLVSDVGRDQREFITKQK